jgi:aminoglycoside phosphotransferase family enzyme
MQDINSPVTTAQKVQFLRQPTSYSDSSVADSWSVDVIETHMSWVFLTQQHAYKLKKPVRHRFLNFSTLAARYQDCQAELRLNRRLAPQIYLTILPLTVTSQGMLQLDGNGTVVDWLVKMRRLPANAMLDAAIQRHTVEETELTQVVQQLVNFYQGLPPVTLSAAAYRSRLQADLQATLEELTTYANGLPGDRIYSLINQLLTFLHSEAAMFDCRVRKGKVIEGHGDLRPEHICLRPDIAIIDCLEFNQSLRVLDCLDELAFLALECERLGAPWVGEKIFEVYCRTAQDSPPDGLIRFYKAYRACLRAKLAIWHMKEPGRLEAADWFARARTYLHLAEKFLPSS